MLKSVHAIIVPGGFGSRGVEGKIKAIKWARENAMPFLGICLGLQCAIIDIARNVAGIEGATSEEFNADAADPVIAFLPDQVTVTRKGGTMRLGSFEAKLDVTSRVSKLYSWASHKAAMDFPTFAQIDTLTGVKRAHERHRHRYEVNPKYHKALLDTGLIFSGMSPDGTLVEFIELPHAMHPYFVATQAHPEFKSRPYKAQPLFAGLVEAAKEKFFITPKSGSNTEQSSIPLVLSDTSPKESSVISKR